MANIVKLSQLFDALSDKTRLKLFSLLSQQPKICVGQLAAELNISSACVSQHMKQLLEAGLVTRTRNGQKVCYQVAISADLNLSLQQLIFGA